MRRVSQAAIVLALQIALLLVVSLRAALPALPLFVCTQMGGAHLLSPCCTDAEPPARALAPPESPTLKARCCEAAAHASPESLREFRRITPAERGVAAEAVVLLPTAYLLPPLLAPPAVRPQPARDRPPPIGPPPPLHQILRI